MTIYFKIRDAISKPVPSVSLAFFRVVFGALMFIGTLRFILKGWVYDFYIAPQVFFPYYGFEWAKPLPGLGMYGVFILLLLLSLFIIVGLFYEISISLFFVLFTYTEVIDKTNYLNHYYLISLLSFLMIFLPLNSNYSMDNYFRPSSFKKLIPKWMLLCIQLQIGLVYFFAGIAKIKYDWLIEAQPLKIWLSVSAGLPYIGTLLDQSWMAYVFSWAGMIFDISVPFLLISEKTRTFSYVLIVIFHFFTHLLFNIGMFPLMMMFFALIFFSADFHKKVLDKILFIVPQRDEYKIANSFHTAFSPIKIILLSVFFVFQILFPLRYLLYPGDLFMTEQGFRFSWNVMLMEKSAHTEFYLKDSQTGKRSLVKPSRYLTRQQQRMMSTQPDMILQFAHFIANEYKERTGHEAEVYTECYVAVNGKASKMLIDPEIDLAKEQEGWKLKKWLLE